MFEVVRILQDTKPKWFIIENVASMQQAHRDEITELLGVQPVMINSAVVSAQNRKRLYWTNLNIQNWEDRCAKFCNRTVRDILMPCPDVTDLSVEHHQSPVHFFARYARLGRGRLVCSTSYGYKLTASSDIKSLTLLKTSGHFWLYDRRFDSTTFFPVLGCNGLLRKFHPVELERLQEFKDGWTEGHSYASRVRLLGNAVTCSVVALIVSYIPDA